MRIENYQRNIYDREYLKLPKKFQGFEIWRLGYIKRMFAELAVIPNDRLLDVGVGGTGYTVIASSSAGSYSVGTDISEVACARATDYAAQCGVSALAHFVTCSATHLPFQDAAFSKVISNAVLEHVEDDDVALDELGRVSRNGGRVLVCVPNTYMTMAWPLALLNIINHRRVGHLRHYASTDLVTRGARRGLRAIDVTFHAHVIKIVQTVLAMVFPAGRRPVSRVWWFLERKDLDAKSDVSGMNVTVTFEKVVITPFGVISTGPATTPAQDMHRSGS
jgi:SAM-dependent methyltransferase